MDFRTLASKISKISKKWVANKREFYEKKKEEMLSGFSAQFCYSLNIFNHQRCCFS